MSNKQQAEFEAKLGELAAYLASFPYPLTPEQTEIVIAAYRNLTIYNLYHA